MVLDHCGENRLRLYLPRTNTDVLRDFCRHLEYNRVFHAKDAGGQLIYHTNVMMWWPTGTS